MKLFAVYLGGKAKGANIEVHDVVFVVGKDIKETFNELKQKWFGNPNSVHIDSYIELNQIGEYQISVSLDKRLNQKSLYFLNIGYCLTNNFGEQHNFHFLISESINKAKEKAKELFSVTPLSPHVDNLMDIDSLIQISQLGKYYIHIEKEVGNVELIVNNVYWPIK
jgi:hypothetical protein